MKQSTTPALDATFESLTARRGRLLQGLALCAGLFLTGCAMEWQNRQAAQEVAQRAKPPGSVYTGWRVFQDKCVACHGPAATGTKAGPDLLPRVRDMGAHRFVNVVLKRYDWNLPGQAGGDAAALDALVEKIMQRKAGALVMPAWDGEPLVTAHIVDLYAYLAARADGTQGPGRPVQ